MFQEGTQVIVSIALLEKGRTRTILDAGQYSLSNRGSNTQSLFVTPP